MSERRTQTETERRVSVRDLARFGRGESKARIRAIEEYECDCAAEGRTPPRARLRFSRQVAVPVQASVASGREPMPVVRA